MHNNLILAQPSDEKLYVEDVFSTWLYTGNGGTQTITNGIDLAGKGGLVWIKDRTNAGATDPNHYLTSSDTSFTKTLQSNATSAAINYSALQSVSNTGFVDKARWPSGNPMVSWTFRKAPKFFDVVTYTGNGANRTISHGLGVAPGMIIIKRTDATSDWQVYHRSLANTEYLVLNTTAAKATGATRWNSTTPTATEFSLGTDATVNASGGSYVAYLFAHDTTADGIVQCGSFTTNGSGDASVTLGYEPQWLLMKNSSGGGAWLLTDTMRGFNTSASDAYLYPNLSNAEVSGQIGSPTATGFDAVLGAGNASSTFIYLAIRRGPMKTPTDATKVFTPVIANSVAANTSISTTNLADAVFYLARTGGPISRGIFFDRLRGLMATNSPWLGTAITNAEFGQTTNCMSAQRNTGVLDNWTNANLGAINTEYSVLSRAPSFFDVVCYSSTLTGTQFANINHNLSAVPELIIVKGRSGSSSVDYWAVYSATVGNTKALLLNDPTGPATNSTYWNNTTPTSSVFTVGANSRTGADQTSYVAYLFATCPGVSKVGSYTGTGATKQIDCGFTNGARFVMIKRADSTGAWYVFDTARGIVSGNDPYLLLNSTAAEVTNTDYIDPYSAGFELSSTAPAGLNANGGTYIYLAIA